MDDMDLNATRHLPARQPEAAIPGLINHDHSTDNSSRSCGATEARFTAREPAGKKPVATSKEKLADATRQRPVVAPCTLREIAVIALEWDA